MITTRQLIAALSLASIAGGVGWLAWKFARPAPPQAITIAIPRQISAGTVLIAQERGYFRDQQLQVTLQTFTLGKQALQAMLDGKADLALVADVPFMLARNNKQPINIVATVFASRNMMALVGLRDRGIGQVADLPGKTLGMVKGTNAEYFLDKLLTSHSIPDSAVTIVSLQPEQFSEALKSGRVDALTAWNPLLNRLRAEIGANGTVMTEPDLFVYRFVLVGKKRFLDTHLDTVTRTLAAMGSGAAFIQEQPVPSQAIIARAIGLTPQQLAPSFSTTDYALSLDQALLLSLDDQTRWAMKRGIVAAGEVPNYLDAIDVRPLAAVQPTAVKLIR